MFMRAVLEIGRELIWRNDKFHALAHLCAYVVIR